MDAGSATDAVSESDAGSAIDAGPSPSVLQFGGTGWDYCGGLAVDHDGNVVLAASSDGALHGLPNLGGHDVFVSKFSSNGQRTWTTRLATNRLDDAKGVAVTPTGEIIVAGLTRGAFVGLTNAGGVDVFLSKLDRSGGILWIRQFGSSSDEQPNGIATDSNGNAYLVGHTYGSLFGTFSRGQADYFAARFDGTGQVTLAMQMGTSEDDRGTGVASDSNGNVVLAGYSYGQVSGGPEPNPNRLGSDIFVERYSSSGYPQWATPLETARDDKAFDIAADNADNVYITGLTAGRLDGNQRLGQDDVFLTKMNGMGQTLWTRQYGGLSNDVGLRITVGPFGSIFVAGETSGSLTSNANHGNADVFVSKFDSDGNNLWTRQLGTPSFDHLCGLAVDRFENVWVGGDTQGSFGGNRNAGGTDLFLAKYDTTGVLQTFP